MRIEWTPEKCDKLRRMYSTREVDDIAAYFGCSKGSIYNRACIIGLKKRNRVHGRPWSAEHYNIMLELWPNKEEIARCVGRSVDTIAEHARKNGLKIGYTPKRKWTPDEDTLLRELYPVIGRKQTAIQMGIAEQQIKTRAKRIGLRAENWHWSADEVALLKEKFPTCDMDELEVIFNRSRRCINAKAFKIGLAKSKDFISDASIKNWMQQSFRARKQSDIVDSIININPSILRLKKAQIILTRKLREIGYKPIKPEFWTPEKDAIIIGMYQHCRIVDILDKVGCSKLAFHNRAKYLGLGKKNRIVL